MIFMDNVLDDNVADMYILSNNEPTPQIYNK